MKEEATADIPEPLPCPFCGSKPNITHGSWTVTVRCSARTCEASSVSFLLAQWNTRINSYDKLKAENQALREAALFVRAFLSKLEDGGGYYDPLTEARRKFHAPLHAKLDAALGGGNGND